MIRSRRKPGGLPNLTSYVARALQYVDGVQSIPKAMKDPIRALLIQLQDLAREQDRFNRYQIEAYDSLPAPHADTHRPQTGSDPLATGDADSVLLGEAADDGTANTFALSDHQHETVTLQAQVRALVSLRIG